MLIDDWPLQADAILTKFKIFASKCIDDDPPPITYKFGFYLSYEALQTDLISGSTMGLNIIKDFSLESTITTILPNSDEPGKPLLFFIVVQDSLGGIRNFTNPIPVRQLSSESLDVPSTMDNL